MMEKLKPLQIKCSNTDCENDLHYFRPSKKMINEGLKGHCRACKANPVDWERVHQRDFNDIKYTVKALNYEFLRYNYWNVFDIDEDAFNKAYQMGKKKLRREALKFIKKAVGKRAKEYFRDGIQTPKTGNIIFYAQHATGTCCRKCVEEWHGIPGDDLLNEDDIGYFVNLAMFYMEDRLPGLPE